MPELQQLTRTRETSTDERHPAATPAPEDDGTTLSIGGADATVSGDPTDAEAAALAAVLAEHLRAEGEAGTDADGEPRYAVDPWCLAGRLGLRSPSGVPAACPSGREWKVAGRAATR
jgi:hypothetical protein